MSYDLIVPDIHEKIDIADQILKQYPDARHNIWLGAYWDSVEFAFSPKHWHRVALWLNHLSTDPKNILLAGNHDIQYFGHGAEQHMCSGYNNAKHQMISEQMPSNWITQRTQWLHTVNHADKLSVISHAGLNLSHVRRGADLSEPYFTQLNRRTADNYAAGIHDPILQAGQARGGRGIGGITWQDWRTEYRSLPGVRQIVGHSSDHKPRWNGADLCLDTDLKYVALMDTVTGELTIKHIDW